MADLLVLAIFLFSLINIVATSLISTGQTLLLNDIPYYVPATPYTTVSLLTSLKALGTAGGLVPVTVVRVSASNTSLSTLRNIINGYGADDVWNDGFLEGECIGGTLLLAERDIMSQVFKLPSLSFFSVRRQGLAIETIRMSLA
jgi:hypothetical protein